MWKISPSFNPHADKTMVVQDTTFGNEIWFDYDDVNHQEIDALAAEIINILNEPENLARVEQACQAVYETTE